MPQFRSDRRTSNDYGLLVAAATLYNDSSVGLVQQQLSEHGIRSTISGPELSGPGIARKVLVFPEDHHRAFRVLCNENEDL
ncbi:MULTISPECIES: hypothetical protein [Rhodococcus]|uniref:hypothetical protein n=1 Tax=Rhodococcus TaxID=1827 RepID=UPI0006422EB4|nr:MULTISPECIES: hypothetical protein [Rhodococcus]NHP18342.1 hypothetical protein [Rhodococcus sp. IC4_135]KLN71588.1 hypothetical protein ABM90_11105 [Rhodococcus erythropolis]KSU60282.1 hypothetical protein AS032_34370 [Rhodococcus qingshengii]MBY6382526.1 hypothetical protein [Rhodococcus erythropolis]OFE10833.1 hypothetical protein A5N83_00570 [Rhodococcus sp. 1139]